MPKGLWSLAGDDLVEGEILELFISKRCVRGYIEFIVA